MAVSYTTLLSRLGRLFDFAKTVRTHQSTLRSEFEDTATNYSDSTRDQMSTLTSGIESRIDEAGRIVQDLRADASKTLLEMMDADTTLGSVSVQSAIEELIRQLAAASQTVDRPASGYVTLPASNRGTAGGSNVGDGLLLLSDMAPIRNLSTSEVFDFPSIRTETIRATCIQDSTSPNVQEGSERFRIEGQRDIGRLDEDWPLGSGTRGVLTVAAANKDGGRTPAVNVCTNSDFEDFTSNTPDKWTIVTGTAGTHVLPAAAGFTGSNALKLVGDGSTATNLKQTLRITTGTLGQINPDRPYSITCAAKYATAAPTSSLVISVRDSSGTILHDSIVGRAMQLTILSASLTTSYQLFSAVVFSPVAIPKGSVIDIRFSGNQANTSQVFIDELVIAEMPRFQRGGLAYQITRGETDYAIEDVFTADVTNNCTTGDGEIALEFDRFFDMASLGLVLPSDDLADACGRNLHLLNLAGVRTSARPRIFSRPCGVEEAEVSFVVTNRRPSGVTARTLSLWQFKIRFSITRIFSDEKTAGRA
jgi:hypothetical protein